jgi:hypothetical protein
MPNVIYCTGTKCTRHQPVQRMPHAKIGVERPLPTLHGRSSIGNRGVSATMSRLPAAERLPSGGCPALRSRGNR